MSLFSVICIVIVFVGLMIFIFSLAVYTRAVMNDEHGSSFECGFSPLVESNVVVSVRFYHMLIVFLLMDVEVVLLFFMPYLYTFSEGVFEVLVVIVVMYFIGLVYELYVGGLSWSN